MKLLSAVSSKRMIMAKTKNQLACQWSEERNISKKQEKKKKKKNRAKKKIKQTSKDKTKDIRNIRTIFKINRKPRKW